MEDIVILGSTGSIGTQACDVARLHKIRVRGLTGHTNTRLLEKQAREFHPDCVCVSDEQFYGDLKQRLADTDIRVLSGMEGLCEVASLHSAHTVLNALVGMDGLLPTLSAVEMGKKVALANKETLVAGGELVMHAARENGAEVLPVDSEHSAIFQCLQGNTINRVRRLILTASGGPFYGYTPDDLRRVTLEDALRHPNWSMGAKVSIDSATLMNKGLELIEAVRLFDVAPDQVDVVIHRESIVHSMVEYEDGAVMAQLGTPDMRLPIQYALLYPQRLPSPAEPLSLTQCASLTFAQPDEGTFSCLPVCREAVRKGGTAPAFVNGANEAAVALFREGQIGFSRIGELVSGALEKILQEGVQPLTSVSDVLQADAAAREYVYSRTEHSLNGKG